MYHKQAIDLAHELTNFVVADTAPVQQQKGIQWPEPAEVEGCFQSILHRLFLIDSHEISQESLMKEDLGLDSLDRVELVMNIEREMGFSLHDQEWTCLRTYREWHTLLYVKADRRH